MKVHLYSNDKVCGVKTNKYFCLKSPIGDINNSTYCLGIIDYIPVDLTIRYCELALIDYESPGTKKIPGV